MIEEFAYYPPFKDFLTAFFGTCTSGTTVQLYLDSFADMWFGDISQKNSLTLPC